MSGYRIVPYRRSNYRMLPVNVRHGDGSQEQVLLETGNQLADNPWDFRALWNLDEASATTATGDTEILVRNDSGGDLSTLAVVGLNNATLPVSVPADSTHYTDKPEVSVVTPTIDHVGRFAILQQDIAMGGYGFALLSAKACWVKVSVADAAHKWAECNPADSAKLLSGSSGSAQILWKESGTGTKWAVIRFPFKDTGKLTFPTNFLIDEAAPDVSATGAALVNNFKAANAEQRVLLKPLAPFGALRSVSMILTRTTAVGHCTSAVATYADFYVEVRPVLEDFTAPTWNNKPAVGALIAELHFGIADVLLTFGGTAGVVGDAVASVTSLDVPNDAPCYGLELRLVFRDSALPFSVLDGEASFTAEAV